MFQYDLYELLTDNAVVAYFSGHPVLLINRRNWVHDIILADLPMMLCVKRNNESKLSIKPHPNCHVGGTFDNKQTVRNRHLGSNFSGSQISGSSRLYDILGSSSVDGSCHLVLIILYSRVLSLS